MIAHRHLSLPMTRFKLRTRAVVTGIDSEDPSTLRKMAALGALPGTEMVLVQNYPAYVFEMGFARFSIDRELAELIYLKEAGRPPAP